MLVKKHPMRFRNNQIPTLLDFIIINTPEHFQYKKAKWERFIKEVEDSTARDNENESDIVITEQNFEYIDLRINKWTQNIIKARENNIPKSKTKTNMYYRDSDKLNLLTNAYKIIKTRVQINGPTAQTDVEIRSIQSASNAV